MKSLFVRFVSAALLPCLVLQSAGRTYLGSDRFRGSGEVDSMTPFVEQAIPPHALLQRSPILKPASSSNEKRALGEKVLSEIHTFEKRGGFGIVTWRMIGKY